MLFFVTSPSSRINAQFGISSFDLFLTCTENKTILNCIRNLHSFKETTHKEADFISITKRDLLEPWGHKQGQTGMFVYPSVMSLTY
jgi:hypothetical protein